MSERALVHFIQIHTHIHINTHIPLGLPIDHYFSLSTTSVAGRLSLLAILLEVCSPHVLYHHQLPHSPRVDELTYPQSLHCDTSKMSLEHNEQMLPVDLVAPNAFGSYMGSQHDGNGNGNSGESDTFAPLHSASSSSVNELCHSFGPNPAPVPAPTPMPMIGSGGAIPQSIDHFSSQTYTGLLPAPMMAHGATTPSSKSNYHLYLP